MFDFQPEFVCCGDARIAYYDAGRGKPLVLLHGNGEDSSYWKAQIPEFTRFFPRDCGGQPRTRRVGSRNTRVVL